MPSNFPVLGFGFRNKTENYVERALPPGSVGPPLKEGLMAKVGDRCRVGTPAPETGQYKHSVCANTEIFNKTNILAPCANASCPNKGADWVLNKILT